MKPGHGRQKPLSGWTLTSPKTQSFCVFAPKPSNCSESRRPIPRLLKPPGLNPISRSKKEQRKSAARMAPYPRISRIRPAENPMKNATAVMNTKKINRHSFVLAIMAGVVLSMGLWGASAARAQYTINTLASFNVGDGAGPEAGLILSGNTLYGTTGYGGADGDGTVFSVPVTGGTPTVLASFNGSNGPHPSAGLTLSGNTLYGTTYFGGIDYGTHSYGSGTVFSVP